MPAFKCLQQALKADQDLMRLFENISEIKARKSFDAIGSAQGLEELKLNDEYRNQMASTYLNIWAILSLMNNHEKALNMTQKWIELVTNQNKVNLFHLESYVQKLENSLRITLAAGYFNKAVELEHLNSLNKFKRQYGILAYSSIENALKVWNYIKNSNDLVLVKEIK